MPTRDELLDLFRKSGALLEGHFRLSSGLHSTGYLQCALVLQHPAVGRAARARHRRAGSRAGADGGALAGAWRRRDRPRGRPRARCPRAVCRTPGRRADAAPRLRALRVGPRARRRGRAARPAAPRARRCRWRRRRADTSSAPRAIVDRSGGTAAFDVPFQALLDVDLPTYQPDACPLCAQGLPVVKPGSRPVVA